MTRQRRLPDQPVVVSKRKLPAIAVKAEGCPTWRFSAIRTDGPWSWGDDPSTNLLQFHEWAKDYETMTWDEIFRNGSAGKTLAVETLPKAARAELARCHHDDIDEVVELRPAGKPRVLGFRHGSSLLLVWWDSGHSFFPVKKNRPPTGNKPSSRKNR